MQTIRDYISQVWDGLDVSTDDTLIYDQFVYNQLKMASLELIRQETDKGRLDASNAQLYTNVVLERTDISECIEFESGCSILKSKTTIPAIIDNERFGKLIYNIYTNTGTIITRTRFQDWTVSKRRTHKLDIPKAFLRGDHLYVVNYDEFTPCLDVNMEAFFENPEEVEMLMHPEDCPYIPDLKFHLPGYIGRRAIEIVKADIREKYRIGQDVRNNAKEDVSAQPTQ